MRPWYVAAIALLVVACNEPQAGTADTPVRPKGIDATRAYMFRTCPVSSKLAMLSAPTPVAILEGRDETNQPHAAGALAALAGAVAEPLVGLAGDAVAAWLEERAAEQSATTTALANGTLLTKSAGAPSSLPCLVLVDGRFGVPDDKLDTATLVPASDRERDAWDWPAPWLSLFGLKDKPRLYMELMMMAAPRYDAFRIVPLFVDLRQTAAKRGKGKPVHLTLTADFSLRGSKLGAGVVALPSPVAEMTRLTADRLGAVSSAWIALPRPLKANATAIDPEHVVDGPLSVQLTVVESVAPSRVDKLIAKTFGAIRQPLAEQLISAVRSGSVAAPPASPGPREQDITD